MEQQPTQIIAQPLPINIDDIISKTETILNDNDCTTTDLLSFINIWSDIHQQYDISQNKINYDFICRSGKRLIPLFLSSSWKLRNDMEQMSKLWRVINEWIDIIKTDRLSYILPFITTNIQSQVQIILYCIYFDLYPQLNITKPIHFRTLHVSTVHYSESAASPILQ